MKLPLGFLTILGCIHAIFAIHATGQNLPISLSFTVSGSFVNGVASTNDSLLIADNNLTNGYAPGMDLYDAPTSLASTGPAGSAAFQWGTALKSSSYAHTSALWFEPLSASNVAPNQYFNLGNLYYRNGTITSNTGASSVDLAVVLNFSNPSGIAPVSATFSNDLINSPNTSNQVASADTVSLRNLASPLQYTDAAGNRYFLELTFKVDQDTQDGTLSSPSQFKVFEGGQGRAELLGRFTVTPAQITVPEPSTALLTVLGALALFRRKR